MPKKIELSYKQGLFVESTARIIGLFGGIGSGKTTAGAIKTIKKISQGEDGIAVGPDFPHFSKSTWPELSRWLPWSRCVNRHLNHPYTQEKILKFNVRGKIVSVYYGGIDNPASWAGPSVNWFWFDEARRKPTRQAFDILMGRIRVGDSLAQGYITTTPRASLKGQSHWLAEVFMRQDLPQAITDAVKGLGQDLVEYFSIPTWENMHNLDPVYLASLLALYRGKYALQELGGELVTFEGAVYPDFGDDNITEEAEYEPGVPVIWGVDDGFTKGHPRIILMAQVKPPYIDIFDEYVATYENAEDSLANALKKGRPQPYPKPTLARCDSSAAELISRLWGLGIETSKGSHDVMEGIKHTRSLMRDAHGVVHIRFHPRCEFSSSELMSYSYPDTVEGNIAESSPQAAKPLKEADNASDALRYLVWPIELNDLIRRGKRGQSYLSGKPLTYPQRPQPGYEQQIAARPAVEYPAHMPEAVGEVEGNGLMLPRVLREHLLYKQALQNPRSTRYHRTRRLHW